MIPVGLAGGSAVLLGWNLGARTLADFDEAIYAEIAREMTRDRSWIVLHFNYAPWYQKPPLLMWIQAVLFQIFGASDVAARMPSLVAGACLVSLTYVIARRYLEWQAALLSALVLAGCYQFAAAARFATTDMLLTLFIYLQVWAYLRVREGDERSWYIAGAAAGLGIMTKGAAGLAGPLILFVALAADGKLGSAYRGRSVWQAVALTLAIALPWHVLALANGGRAFLDDYVGYHLLRRTTQPIEGHEGSVLTYFAYIRNQFFPWAYLALFAVPAHAYRWYRHRDVSSVLLATVLVVLVLYTGVQTKLVWYILPVYPALSMVTAALLWRAAVGGRFELALVAAAGILGALLIPHQFITYPRSWAYGYLAALALAGLVFWALKERQRGAAVVVVAALTVGFFAAASLYRDVALYSPDSPAIVTVARAAHGGTPRPLGVLINDKRLMLDTPVWPDLLWYSDRPLVTIEGSTPIAGISDFVLADRPVSGLRTVFVYEGYAYATTAQVP